MPVDFACLYSRFDPAVPLTAGDPVYVDWQAELGLADVKQRLLNGVRLSGTKPSHRLLTGTRGGGKTTELKRLQQSLESLPEGQRYFVAFLDADDAIDLDDADPTDLVLAIVRQLVSDLRRADVPVKLEKRFRAFLESARDALTAVLGDGVDLKVGDPMGIVELSTTLQRQPSTRRNVRELLEGRLPTLYDAINEELLPSVLVRLRERGYAGLLVIVDQLDRIPPDGDRHHTVFWEGRGKLKALDCHVLYTVPIEYAYSRALPRLENEYSQLLGLPLVPVGATDAALRDGAIGAMREIAAERIAGCGTDVDAFLGSRSVLDELVCLSGGHLRTFFLILRTAIERSDLTAPLSAEHIERVVADLAAAYLDPLEVPEREVVASVHESNERPTDEKQLDRFYDLLRDQYVFAYAAASERWYDWNPLLGRSALGQP